MALLEEVERINPNYADLHYNKAYLLTHLEDWDGAKEEVEKELKNNPSNFNALVMKEALQHREEQNKN